MVVHWGVLTESRIGQRSILRPARQVVRVERLAQRVTPCHKRMGGPPYMCQPEYRQLPRRYSRTVRGLFGHRPAALQRGAVRAMRGTQGKTAPCTLEVHYEIPMLTTAVEASNEPRTALNAFFCLMRSGRSRNRHRRSICFLSSTPGLWFKQQPVSACLSLGATPSKKLSELDTTLEHKKASSLQVADLLHLRGLGRGGTLLRQRRQPVFVGPIGAHPRETGGTGPRVRSSQPDNWSFGGHGIWLVIAFSANAARPSERTLCTP